MISFLKWSLLIGAITALNLTGESAALDGARTSAQPWQENRSAHPLFTLTVSAVHDVVASGTPVKIRITTTDVSGEEIWFWDRYCGGAVKAYTIHVNRESGDVPPDTKVGRVFRYSDEHSPNIGRGTFMGGSVDLRRLKPGETSTSVVDVSTWYDLSLPGTYTIEVEETAGHSPGSGAEPTVKSNPISVTVIPAGTGLSAEPGSAAPGSQPPFSLTIRADDGGTVRAVGPAVVLEIITRNASHHDIRLRTEKAANEQAGSVYKIAVHNRAGAPAPETEFGRDSNNGSLSPPQPAAASPRKEGESLSLRPGEDWWDTIMLNKLYELSKPGEYTIQVRRWDDETKTWVKSNTITLTVTP